MCGPTGKLVGTFVIKRDGAGMKSSSPINLFASNDEWTAPIMAEVGPDGNVWVLDWYNFIVQHNPTPQGFETGKGAAYETKLRDTKYGRIYRIVPDKPRGEDLQPVVKNNDELESYRTDQLTHPTMQVRLHAQRLIVEHGDTEVVPELISLIEDQTVDGIGLKRWRNSRVEHAAWAWRVAGRQQSCIQCGHEGSGPSVRRSATECGTSSSGNPGDACRVTRGECDRRHR